MGPLVQTVWYVPYVQRHYDSETYVVLDGYGNADEQSVRRAKTLMLSPMLYRAPKMFCFQMNLTGHLENDVTICEAVADTRMVSSTVNLSLHNSNDVVVVGDDTDVAIMLLYHRSEECGNIIFYQKTTAKRVECRIGTSSVCSYNDLFIFGKGKSTLLNELKSISITMNDATHVKLLMLQNMCWNGAWW